MSYNGLRPAPNVSQYIANLNRLPTDLPAQNDFALDDTSLDFLTNTEFFDFDTFNGDFDGQPSAPQQGQNMPPQQLPQGQQQQQKTAGVGVNGAGYQFGEFQTYPSMNSSPSTIASPQNLQGAYATQQQHQPFQPSQLANVGDKRKASAARLPSAADMEEASRFAAEEDKRRRNTAASARFRVKKKQREQTLEKQTKEMSEKLQMLEGKVQQLETENKWLKGLITEKGNAGALAEVGEKADEQEDGERSTEKRSDGVGTEPVKAEA